MFAKTLALTGLATVASAHMLMSNPAPYGKSNLDNGPLLDDGSNFPCKMRTGVYDAQGASNVYKQGSTQTLSFTGQAVHGGGSCQLSITTDLEPNKDSVWKVIKSIEGGCPAKGEAANMGENADADNPYTYDYTIPKELAAGDYTLAWTWFNKVGNREMYMNCAPLTVTGDGGSKDHLDTLPDMFVANIGNECETKPSTDLKFPDPGQDIDRLNGITEAFAEPTGTGCQAGSGDGGDAPAPTSSASVKPTKAPSATNDIPGGVFITVSQPATTEAPAPSQTTKEPVEEPLVTSEAPTATAAPAPDDDYKTPDNGSDNDSGNDSGSGSPSDGFASGSACTSEGEWNCIDGSSFQRCASGGWTGKQTLSEGVTCTPGQATDISLSVKRGEVVMRRALRFRG